MGDIKAAAALCAAQTIIIADFAPHAWQDGNPWHVAVTGDRAYAVYPTRYSYKLNGKPVTELGVWSFALQKLAGGWRVAGWAWAQH